VDNPYTPVGRGHGPEPDGHRRTEGGRQPYQGETYYDLPAIKRTHYGWLIASYFFAGGLAGAAQILATLADLTGGGRDRAVVRAGRYLALGGALASPVFLIADLHTPQRWYNMLRIFRPTSAMSIGSWTLSVFGACSGLAALAQLLDDLTGASALARLARIAGLPAAAAGAVMSTYTGVLLSATSVPLWAAASRRLPALFGASAAATAVAAISLAGDVTGAPESGSAQLEQLGVLTSAAELALQEALIRRLREEGVAGPLAEGRGGLARLGVMGVSAALPLAVHARSVLTGHRSKRDRVLAALATLAGGYALRALLVFAGNQSAERPRDYFRFTQAAGSVAGNGTRAAAAAGGRAP
jgi:protein NrfD